MCAMRFIQSARLRSRTCCESRVAAAAAAAACTRMRLSRTVLTTRATVKILVAALLRRMQQRRSSSSQPQVQQHVSARSRTSVQKPWPLPRSRPLWVTAWTPARLQLRTRQPPIIRRSRRQQARLSSPCSLQQLRTPTVYLLRYCRISRHSMPLRRWRTMQ